MSLQAFSTVLFGALASALLAILIGLHLLRVRHLRLRVPTLLFLRRVRSETKPRALLRRLRRWPSLAFLLLLGLLLLLAAADPEVALLDPHPGAVVVLLDRSASTATRLSGPDASLWGRLRREVLERRDEGGFGDDPALYCAGPLPELIGEFGEDPSAWHENLEALAPSGAAAGWEPAVTLALDRLRERGGGRLVVYSDGDPRLAEVLDSLSLEPHSLPLDVEVRVAVRPRGNRAITAVRVQRLSEAPGRAEIRVHLERFSGTGDPWSAVLERFPSRPAEPLARIELAADAVQGVARFEVPADGALVRVSIEGEDALALDDTCRLRLPGGKRLRVALGAESPVLLRRALELEPTVELVPAGDSADLAVRFDAGGAGGRSGDGSGGVLWHLAAGAPVPAPASAPSLRAAPWLADLPTRDLDLGAAVGLSRRAGDEVLLARGAKALVVRRAGGAFEISLPLGPQAGLDGEAFAPLLLLRVLRELRRDLDPPALVACGQVLPPGSSGSLAAPADPGEITWESDGRRIAIPAVFLDERESDPSLSMAPRPLAAKLVESPLEWRWLAVGFLLLMCLEWALLRRRAIP